MRVRTSLISLDDPSGEPYPWTRLKPIHDLIWKEFTERALDRWPHVEFRLKSEVEGEIEIDETEATRSRE